MDIRGARVCVSGAAGGASGQKGAELVVAPWWQRGQRTLGEHERVTRRCADVALEALQDFRRARREQRRGDPSEWTVDALWRYAGVCRVQTVLRPYLEAVETNG